MNTLRSKSHIWIGIGLLLVISLVLGWFIGHYIPGTPQKTQSTTKAYSYPVGHLTDIPVSEIIDIPFGDTTLVEGMTRGKKLSTVDVDVYTYRNGQTGEESVEIVEQELVIDPETEDYHTEYPSFEIAVNNAKGLSFDSFSEWYPNYEPNDLLSNGIGRHESKMILVDVTVTNLSTTQTLNLSDVQLWSDGFVQMFPGRLGNGYGISWGAFELLSGLSPREPGDYRDTSYLAVLNPEETRTFTLPYQIYKNAFTDDRSFDNLDLSLFCLEVYDYDPATIYRLWLK